MIEDANEPSPTPAFPKSRETVDSQSKSSTEDARPGRHFVNVEVHKAGQDSARPDGVQAASEAAMSRPSEGVETSAPSSTSFDHWSATLESRPQSEAICNATSSTFPH